MIRQFTKSELQDRVQMQWEDETPGVMAKINMWLERGDGAAIYENHDLSHPGLGMIKIVSYGSPQAKLEMKKPPERMPDMDGDINWRFVLIGTCHD